MANIPRFSKFDINKGISDVLLVIEFAVPVLHVGDFLGLFDLGIYNYYQTEQPRRWQNPPQSLTSHSDMGAMVKTLTFYLDDQISMEESLSISLDRH